MLESPQYQRIWDFNLFLCPLNKYLPEIPTEDRAIMLNRIPRNFKGETSH